MMLSQNEKWAVRQGDCLAVLKTFPDASVDAVVTDPPYGLSKEPDIAEVLRHWLAGDRYEHGAGGFMGKTWDSFVPGPEYWREVYRVLKPGGHLLAFGGTRTFDLLSIAIRMAGFENRDTISDDGMLRWIYGQGFPKSLDVSKAIDKMAGAVREVVGIDPARAGRLVNQKGGYTTESGWSAGHRSVDITAPSTEDAKRWQGYGTALKPAWEPILVFRKPLKEGTVAEQVLKTGTGALNIDGCRVESGGEHFRSTVQGRSGGMVQGSDPREGSALGMFAPEKGFEPTNHPHPGGRWPANLVLTHLPGCRRLGEKAVKTGTASEAKAVTEPGYQGGWGRRDASFGYASEDGTEMVESWSCEAGCPVRMMDEQSVAGGMHPAGNQGPTNHVTGNTVYAGGWTPVSNDPDYYKDTGGASRFFQTFEHEPPFFYAAKVSRSERDEGLKGDAKNSHPTVKPKALLAWLVRLVTPKGGLCLDPFCGSGTTGCAAVEQGFRFVGIEMEPEYVEIAQARIKHSAGEDAERSLFDEMLGAFSDG